VVKDARIPVVGIGASAGGIEALEALLGGIPAGSGMAYVVVQHLPPTHTSMLAEILGRACKLPVGTVSDGVRVVPDRVYVAPPGSDLELREGCIHLKPRAGPPEQHRPIDRFFCSLAEERKELSIGVILSGSGSDGTAGLQAIKAEGGITFAQDDSAQQEGMPRSAIAMGAVDFVRAPREIAREILEIGRHPYVAQPPAAGVERPAPPPASDLDRVLALLRQGTGADFSQYKFNTLVRRINRRIVLLRLENLKQYADVLQRNPAELEALYQDILINVTSFFRNPEAFEVLKTRVLPQLLKDRPRHDPLRIWSIGCSTGQEAYSLAMMVAECLRDMNSPLQVQIYATDLNGSDIDRARLGFYPRSAIQDVSQERQRRFFVESDGGYRISKAIRDMCVFARQNVLSDPPFSRMDLIACRNVLIYIEQRLQRKLLPMLHYALKPNGYLFLGSSETIGSYRDLFEVEDAKHKIYSKKAAPVRADAAIIGAGTPTTTQGYLERRADRTRESVADTAGDAQREADRILLARYVPSGVLVNDELDVLQFRGDTGFYLAPAPGKASLNLLKMAREGLMVPLRAAVQRARKDDAAAHEEGVRVRSNGGYREVNLTVIPVGGASGRCFLILFEDPSAVRPGPAAPAAAAVPASAADAERQIQRLTQELGATREYLQSVIEQQEAANEELQSANEEVQSANEELQSINEELETSKEEIQSSNEELTTVNEELQHRNEELAQANNDLNNLIASVQVAIVMVWQDLRIRRFTPMAEKLLNLIAGDVGRPIGDIKTTIEGPDIAELVREVIDTVSVRELEMRARNGRWYSLRVRPYRTMENKIDGAVIMLVDIHDLKQTQEQLAWQARVVEQTHEPIVVRRRNGEIVFWNRGAERLYGHSRDEAVGKVSAELLGTRTEGSEGQADDMAARDGAWNGELIQRTKDGRSIVVESTIRRVEEPDEPLLIETSRDITRRKELEANLRNRVRDLAAADEQKNEFVAMLAHELRNPLAPIRNALEIFRTKDARDDAELTRVYEMLERQVSKMSRIVSDLLEAAQVSRSELRLSRERVDLQLVIQRSADLLQHAARLRRQTVDVVLPAEPLTVWADATRLEQVFANLLENAIKFTPEGGRIEFIAREANDGPGGRREAVVCVRDNGAGISKELLPHVFDLFVQGRQSLDRAVGGLGIGLILVRGLIERHGGTVTARSAGVGQGAEFEVRLPLTDNSDAQPGDARPSPGKA